MEIYVPAHAARALEALEAAGWESWAVGGCVRDALLGLSPHDWDLCTAAAPEQVLACFAGKRLLETGRKHGTVTLLTPDGPSGDYHLPPGRGVYRTGGIRTAWSSWPGWRRTWPAGISP